MNWYVVHTAVGKEGFVDHRLQELGCETLFIRQRCKVRVAHRTETRLRPYFPRYVFAAVPETLGLYYINTLPHVSTVLYNSAGPFTLSTEAVEDMKARCNQAGVFWSDDACEGEDAFDTTTGHLGRRYRAGEAVRVILGPFLNLVGVVIEDLGAAVSVLFGELKVMMPPRCLEPEAA